MVDGAKEDLWNSVVQSNTHMYKEVLQSLHMTVPLTTHIPVRVFIRKAGQRYTSSYQDVYQTSRPIQVTGGTGDDVHLTTLRDSMVPLLKEFAKDMEKKGVVITSTIQQQRRYHDGATEGGDGNEDGSGDDAHNSINTGQADANNTIDDDVSLWNRACVWVGGVRPPPESALQELHAELHAADFFLYISMHLSL